MMMMMIIMTDTRTNNNINNNNNNNNTYGRPHFGAYSRVWATATLLTEFQKKIWGVGGMVAP